LLQCHNQLGTTELISSESFQVQALFVLSARPWMRFIVYLGKMLKIKVRIDLGCTDIRMAH
jgi:hypothetical protein